MIIKNERKAYPTDLTDSQWDLKPELFPRAGNKSKREKRELVNAVLYIVHNGCKWRNLPRDFPPCQTVASFYCAAIKSGLMQRKFRRRLSGSQGKRRGAIPSQPMEQSIRGA